MPRFHYIASDKSGRVVEGDMVAQSEASVLGWMSDQDLKPVAIKTLDKKNIFTKSIGGDKITLEDKVFITKYLALMLRVGTDLFKAIDILVADFEKQAVKSFLLEVKDSLGKGQPLHTAFERHPKEFSPVFISLIKAGEASGNLEAVFERLSGDLEKENELRSRIKSSMIYPFILVGLSLVVLFLMVSLALPRIAETFLNGGIDPPAFSRAVFSMGLFIRDYMWLVLPLILISAFSTWYFFAKTLSGKRVGQQIIRKTPVVKDVVLKISLQRFAATLASLLRSGMPILDAIEVTANAVGSEQLKTVLMRISRDGIAKGMTVGEAFRKETYFPRVVVNLVAISEQTGHMDEVLETLSKFYESEIDGSIKILVSFLEPVLLLVIGVVVGLIALAIIVPVYQLVGQI